MSYKTNQPHHTHHGNTEYEAGYTLTLPCIL